jgi:hypothetical protein
MRPDGMNDVYDGVDRSTRRRSNQRFSARDGIKDLYGFKNLEGMEAGDWRLGARG